MARQLKYTITADSSQASKEFNRLEKKIERLAKTMAGAGKDLAKVTAPFAALGAIAVNEALEFERAFSKIRVGTGATGKALEGLVADFEKVNKQVSQADETVAQALADINTRLGLTGNKLSDTTKSFMDLSRILGADATEMIKTASQAMNNWGISANDTTAFLDKLYTASYTMGIGVNELASSVSAIGGTFRNAGIGIEETIAIVASFEKAGLSAQSMIMPLNTAMANLAKKGCTDLSGGLIQVISSIKNAKTTTEAVNIAVENFGRRGANLANAIRDGRFEVDELVNSLKNSSGALSQAAKDTMTTGEQFKLLKKQAEDALEPLGKQLLKIAVDYMPKVQKGIEWLGSESGLQAVKIGMLGAAFSGLVVVLGTAIEKIAVTLKALKTLTVFLASNPYVLAALAGVALGKGAVDLTNWVKDTKFAISYNKAIGGSANPKATQAKWSQLSEADKAEAMRHSGSSKATIQPTVANAGKVGGISATLSSTGKKTGSGSKAEDYSKQLSQAILEYNNASGINNAAAQMQIYATALSKVSAATGTAKQQTEAWQEKLRLTNAFGSAMSDRIEEITDAFDKGIVSYEEASAQLGEISSKYQLTAAQSDTLKNALSELSQKANENTAAFMENARAMEEFANEERLKRVENAYNAQTAFGGTATKETAQAYVAVLKQMRAEVEVGSIAWQQMGEKIRDVENATLGINWGNLQTEINAVTTETQGLASKFGIGLADALAMAAKGSADLSDSLQSLLQDMGALIVKAVALNAIKSIFTGLTGGGWDFSGLFKGIFKSGVAHTGGVIGETALPTRLMPASAYAHAPRLHNGNLRADEYPAILQKGETVIPKNAHFGSAGNGESPSTTYNITIQAADAQSFVQLMQKNKGSFESMIVNSIQRGGGIRSAIKGAMA